MNSCTAVKTTGKVLGAAGKVTFAAAKTAGKAAYHTARFAGKGAKSVVNMAIGKEVIALDKQCNTFYVDAVLNRKLKTNLVLDTGCSETQISRDIAKKLGINTNNLEKVSCQLADGRIVMGSSVNLKEVRLGRARVSNVRAIVLDDEKGTGLLGMSYLDNFVFKVDTEKKHLILQRR